MTDFREDLLELLLTKPLEYVNIYDLYAKYCGTDITFDDNDNTKVQCRLKLTQVLIDLKAMNWIAFTPGYGFSTAHRRINDNTTRRIFTLNDPVLVRLSTNGELEYKKSKQLSSPLTYNDNSIKVGDGFKGNLNTGNNVKQDLTENSKSDKPKWLTLAFYKEELVKHWFKLLLVAIGATLYSWLEVHNEKAKELDKASKTQKRVPMDTTNKKDTFAQ